MGGHHPAVWIGFNVLVVVLLAIDLGLHARRGRVIGFGEAVVWNVLWTAVGLGFSGVIFWGYGPASGLEYLTGYVIERALSLDNIFVFVVIFQYFAVPPAYQYRVLYWGILAALVLRGTLILAGAALVAAFHWVLYVFGAFLLYTGIALLVSRREAPDPEKNPVVRLARKLFALEPRLHGERFFVRVAGRLRATPLFLVLLVVETTDLVFAVDSIPAIFGVTRDPFLIYSSNVFAILGLRVMYFLLAALLPRFRYLRHGLSAVLVLIGLRMLLESVLQVPTVFVLLAVLVILVGSIVLSLARSR
ncbi:MAG: TerC family protein [Planctomycetes bacterium]|nr:TerC family protein [Planctomycetota bacterium]